MKWLGVIIMAIGFIVLLGNAATHDSSAWIWIVLIGFVFLIIDQNRNPDKS